MISKSDDFEMCLNIWCTLLCTCMFGFFSIDPERGWHEQAQSAWTEAFLSERAR